MLLEEVEELVTNALGGKKNPPIASWQDTDVMTHASFTVETKAGRVIIAAYETNPKWKRPKDFSGKPYDKCVADLYRDRFVATLYFECPTCGSKPRNKQSVSLTGGFVPIDKDQIDKFLTKFREATDGEGHCDGSGGQQVHGEVYDPAGGGGG